MPNVKGLYIQTLGFLELKAQRAKYEINRVKLCIAVK